MSNYERLVKNANENATKAIKTVQELAPEVAQHNFALNGLSQLSYDLARRVINAELRIIKLTETAGLPLDDDQKAMLQWQAEAASQEPVSSQLDSEAIPALDEAGELVPGETGELAENAAEREQILPATQNADGSFSVDAVPGNVIAFGRHD